MPPKWHHAPRAPSPVTSSEPNRLGIHELFSSPSPDVDIVAIHGLNGDALRTWTSPKSGACWLRDAEFLPATLPRSRILSYGYDAAVFSVLGRTSGDRILQHAQTLVAELVANRERNGAVERPIIFICHSLGGIVLKRALTYSESRMYSKQSGLSSIFASTYGALFMGTPHHGSPQAPIASKARQLLSMLVPTNIIDSNGQLLAALAENSETLQDINDKFLPLTKNIVIFLFWETLKTDVGSKLAYIVPLESAAPMIDAERAGLPYNHSEMVKFGSVDAAGYKLVASALHRYAEAAPTVILRRWDLIKKRISDNKAFEASEISRE